MKPLYIKKALKETIFSMTKDISRFVKHPGKDFTRNRKISFSDLILSIMSMESHSLNHEIRDFFQKNATRPPSKSAFIQQRDKLNESAFMHLFSDFNKRIPYKKVFQGYHLLACDGSDLNLPPLESDSKTKVRSNTEGVSYQQIHLNAVYDLLENRYADIVIQPRGDYNEGAALIEMLHRNPIPGKSIYIADRGYFSVNLLAHLIRSGQSFLLRMKKDNRNTAFLKRFYLPDDGEFDVTLDFEITRSHQIKYRDQKDRYYTIHPNRRFDLISKNDTQTLMPISVRVVKLALPNGETEFLLTNLSRREFGLEALSELYHLRWGIETSFRSLKYNMALSSFHSVRRDFIAQEIYAKVILYNFTLLLTQCVKVKKNETKHGYKISVADAASIARQYLVKNYTNKDVINLLRYYLTAIRPGRSSPRKVRAQRYKPLNYRN